MDVEYQKDGLWGSLLINLQFDSMRCHAHQTACNVCVRSGEYLQEVLQCELLGTNWETRASYTLTAAWNGSEVGTSKVPVKMKKIKTKQ